MGAKGIMGAPPTVKQPQTGGPLMAQTDRQMQRHKYLQNQPKATGNPQPQQQPEMQRMSPGIYRPMPQQPQQSMPQGNQQQLQRPPQGWQPQPWGQGMQNGLGSPNIDPGRYPMQGGGWAPINEMPINDMRMRYPQGQAQNLQGIAQGISSGAEKMPFNGAYGNQWNKIRGA